MACARIAITTTTLPVGNTSNAYYATLARREEPHLIRQVIGGRFRRANLSGAGVISGTATQVDRDSPQPATFTVQVVISGRYGA